MTQLSLNNILVIKVGGTLLENPDGIILLMQTTAKLINKGKFVVIVHGGGCIVDKQLKANKMHTKKLNGLRITPKEQMPIISGALAGTANKLLQSSAKNAGITSVGLSLADGDLLHASIKDKKLECVGSVCGNNANYLLYILQQHWLPIISSIAVDNNGLLLNINADEAATEIAKLINGKLILLSDVEGVLDSNKHVFQQLNTQQINQLINQGIIADGMKVKVEAALDAANKLNEAVQVASWKDPKQMAALIQDEKIGTSIYI